MKLSCIVVLCSALVLPGCNGPSTANSRTSSASATSLQGRIGQHCQVQFRRDVLGAAAPNGIAPQVGTYNGMALSMYGTLTKVQPDFIWLTSDKSEYAIPVQTILFLEFAIPGR